MVHERPSRAFFVRPEPLILFHRAWASRHRNSASRFRVLFVSTTSGFYSDPENNRIEKACISSAPASIQETTSSNPYTDNTSNTTPHPKMLTFRNVDGSPSDAVYFLDTSDQFARRASKITTARVVLNHETWSEFQISQDLFRAMRNHPHIKELIFVVADIEILSTPKDEDRCLQFVPLKRHRMIWDLERDEIVLNLKFFKEEGELMVRMKDGTTEEWEDAKDDFMPWELMKSNIEEAFDDFYKENFDEGERQEPCPKPTITIVCVKKFTSK
jgi:hypothetical protein